ncbi:MAG: hypothetical protein ACOH5I_22725 [Oligoflexus sp.]
MIWTDLSMLIAITCVALSIGGGLYEYLVIVPQFRRNPPATLSIIHEDGGVPMQRFWIPVHIAISIALLGALILNWGALTWGIPVRRLMILVGIGAYFVMRVWSGIYFIPEMLSFQRVPLKSSPSDELTSRVNKWAKLTILRLPLDLILFVSLLIALSD